MFFPLATRRYLSLPMAAAHATRLPDLARALADRLTDGQVIQQTDGCRVSFRGSFAGASNYYWITGGALTLRSHPDGTLGITLRVEFLLAFVLVMFVSGGMYFTRGAWELKALVSAIVWLIYLTLTAMATTGFVHQVEQITQAWQSREASLLDTRLLPEASRTRCPACGCHLSHPTRHCPDCGLRLG